MTSARNKQPCIKCTKTTGIATCGGCHAWFCTKHFIEHRQNLGEQMEKIGQQHDDLHKNLDINSVSHPLLSQIDNWEIESIRKIHEVAAKARNDAEKYINETKIQLAQSLSKLRDELSASRSSDDFTEIELAQWNVQLEKLRRALESPSAIDVVVTDLSQPLIRVIQRKGMKKHSDEIVFNHKLLYNLMQNYRFF